MASVEQTSGSHKSAITFVFLTVCIDAMGFGIIIPVLPVLIGEVTSTNISGAALWGGYLSFSFAAMQFLVGPTVGNLSDRFGRRPVLLLGFFGLCFLFTAFYTGVTFADGPWVFTAATLLATATAVPYALLLLWLDRNEPEPPGDLIHLDHEEHTAMGEAGLAGPEVVAAPADERPRRGCVVR